MCEKIQLKPSLIKNSVLSIAVAFALCAQNAAAEGFSFSTPEFPGAGESHSGGVSSLGGSGGSGEKAGASGGSDSNSAYGDVPGSDDALATAGQNRRSGPGSSSGGPSGYGSGLSSDAMMSAGAWDSSGSGSSGGASSGGRYVTMLDADGKEVRVLLSADGNSVTFANGYVASISAGGGILPTVTPTGGAMPGRMLTSGVDPVAMQQQGLVKGLIAAQQMLEQDEGSASNVDSYLAGLESISSMSGMILSKNFSPQVSALSREHLDVVVALRLSDEYYAAIDAVESANSSDNGTASAAQKARVKQLENIVLPARARSKAIVAEQARLAGVDIPTEVAQIAALSASSSVYASVQRFSSGREPSPPAPVVTVDPDTGKTSTYIPPYVIDRAQLDHQASARRMLGVGIEAQSHLLPGDMVLPMLLDQIRAEGEVMLSLSLGGSIDALSIKQMQTLSIIKGHLEGGLNITKAEFDSVTADIKAQVLVAGLDVSQESRDYIASGGSAAAGTDENSCNALTAIAKPSVCATGGGGF